METQLEIETINAVPTPRLDVGEKVFAAQLLHSSTLVVYKNRGMQLNVTHMTRGNKL
jgi:hypothetical protein